MEKKQSLSSESDAQSAGRNVKRARPGARVRPRNHRHERNRNEIIKKRNEKKTTTTTIACARYLMNHFEKSS